MIRSLRSFDQDARFLFFHFEDLSIKQLETFGEIGVELYSIQSFLGQSLFTSLVDSREYIELLWTLPSVIAKNLVSEFLNSKITDVVYLDADLFFFGSPARIWEEVPLNEISIVRHNFSARLESEFPKSGEFNVSWVSFPTTNIGFECVSEWATNCILLCPKTPTFLNGRLVYGDQLYLEDWPTRFKGSLHVIRNLGVGVAPWNYENYEITETKPILVNSTPLIFFHFSSHQFGFFLARKMGTVYSAISPIPEEIYRVYEYSLLKACQDLGFKNWKSRFESVHIRLFKNLMRRFKSPS
jgi:hypothetical protein